MSNVVTGGLAGLVVVLAYALWRKEQQQQPQQPPRGTSQAAQQKSRDHASTGDAMSNRKSKAKKNRKKGSKAEDNKAPVENNEVKTTTAPAKEGPASKTGVVNGEPSASPAPKQAKAKEMPVATTSLEPEQTTNGNSNHTLSSDEQLARQLEQSASNGTSVADFSDYEVVERAPRDDNKGWQNVGGKTRVPANVASTVKPKTAPINTWASSNPFAALPDGSADSKAPRVVSINTTMSTPRASNGAANGKAAAASAVNATPTKRQRQNAARAQAKKADKDAQEAERLARLAQHKRQLQSERARAADKRSSPAPYSVPGPGSAAAGGKNGGPRASINENGSLVWD